MRQQVEGERSSEGKLVISHVLQWFLGSLPRWHAHLVCHVSESGKNVGGSLFTMTVVYGKRRITDGKKLKISFGSHLF
jgi:hypothetical protein